MKYKDSFVYVHKVIYNPNIALRKWICPICKKEINNGKVYLIVNNQKYFPNCIIHEECFNSTEEVFKKVEEKALEYEQIKEKYEKLKKMF